MDLNKYFCFICRTNYDKLDLFSGFNVPVDDAKRKRWSQSCGEKLPVFAKVCEKHFSDSDFITKPNNNKLARLIPEALPKPSATIMETNDNEGLKGSNKILITDARTLRDEMLTDDVNFKKSPTNSLSEQAVSSNTQNLCCICHKTSKSDKVILYGLPISETYRKIWCEKLGKNYPSGTQICGNHFRPNDFLISNRQYRLKEEAIPTQNLQGVSVSKAPVNVIFLNQTSQIEHVELPSSSFVEQLDIEESIKTNITRRAIINPTKVTKPRKSPRVGNTPKVRKSRKSLKSCNTPSKSLNNVNTPPKSLNNANAPPKSSNVSIAPETSSKSVQTDVGYVRTCGFIEVSLEHNVFSMNCFYCEEAFPIWSWGEFVTHVRDQHQREEEKLKKEFIESNEIEKPIQPITKGLVYGCDSDSAQEDDNDVKTQPLDLENMKKDISYVELDNAMQEFMDIEEQEKDFMLNNVSNKSEINFIEIDKTDITETLAVEQPEKINKEKGVNPDFTNSNSLLASLSSSSDKESITDNDDEDYVEKTVWKKVKDRTIKKPLNVPCYLCEKLFTTEAHLKIHQAKMHDKDREQERPAIPKGVLHCKICNKTVKAIYYNSHLNKHKPAIYDCEICGKQFQWQYTLRNHLKTHSNQRDYVCEFCGTGYLRYSDMYEHKQRAHSDKKNYRCDICGYTSKTSTNLCVHRRKYHMVLEGSVEELSKKAYRPPGKTVFAVVEDPDTKKQRFKCDLCDNTYALLTGMTRHRQQMHGIIPPKRKRSRIAQKFSENEEEIIEENLVVVNDCNNTANDENYITDMDKILISSNDLIGFNQEN